MNKKNHHFQDINKHPDQISPSAIIHKLLDGIGFRFYWVTEGIKDVTLTYSPGEGRWDIAETVSHIRDLIHWMFWSCTGRNKDKPETAKEQREDVFELISDLQEFFSGCTNDDLEKIRINGLPFWNMISGPMSDTLMHIGQIETIRRIALDPPQEPQYFPGLPPKV